ncbi:DMT family transporter [Thermosphaera sp.]
MSETDYLAPVMASLMWSLNPAVISKYREHIKPVLFTGFRALVALVFLIPLTLLYSQGFTGFTGVAIAVILASAMLGPGVGDASYTRAIQLLGGSLAVVISYTYIFVSQFIATVFLNEPLRLSVIAGSLIAFLGIVLASSNGNGRRLALKGVAYAVVASVSWGVATSMIKVALQYADTLTLTVLRLGFIAVFFIPAGLIVEGGPRSGGSKPLIKASLITGVLGWSIGMLLFIYSINKIGVSATAVATALTPVLSQLTVKLLSREKPTLKTIGGALLISLGTIISFLSS